MRCPMLADLPPAPPGRTGWPWTEQSAPLPTALPDGSAWPRISVATPSYNQGQYLEEAVRSVLLQGYPDLEYIVIDGGSTDGSAAIIEKYAPWLAYWVSEPDRGQSHAINKGFERCTGEIITFLSSDDLYLAGAFGHAAALWAQHRDCGAVVGSFYYMDEHSLLADMPHLAHIPHAGPIDLSLGHPYRLHQVSTFYSRAALDTVGRCVREDLRYTMDRELLYRVCRRYGVVTTARAYGAFRQHAASKSSADILPFSREFARLHLLFLSGDAADDRKRRRAARLHRAKGYLKYARHSGKPLAAIGALLAVPAYAPRCLFQTGYISTWLDVLYLKPAVKRLLRAMGRQ